MNKIKRYSDKTTAKNANKLIKKNIKTPQSKEGNDLLLKATQSKYLPQKSQSKAKINKTLATKLKKYQTKHSKRTTPGEIIGAPVNKSHYSNIEGERWTKVVNLQNKIQSKRLAHKAAKSHEKKRNVI